MERTISRQRLLGFRAQRKLGEKIKVRIKYLDSVSADAEVISRS